jgi:hypothetical protein
MQEINTAYETLSNPVKRQTYDKANPQQYSEMATNDSAAANDAMTESQVKYGFGAQRPWGPFILVAWSIGTFIYFVMNLSQIPSGDTINAVLSITGQILFAGVVVAFYGFVGLFATFYFGGFVWVLCVEPLQKAWKRHNDSPPNFKKEFASILGMLFFAILLSVPYFLAINGTWLPVLSLVSGILMWLWGSLILFCFVELIALTLYTIWARRIVTQTNALLVV